MNANELAVKLANVGWDKPFSNWELLDETATMLRQQQAEIKALNQRIERMIENKSHHEGIAHAGGFEAGYQAAKAKTLTDEEILEIWKEFDDKDADNWFIAIARAILRKAQEK